MLGGLLGGTERLSHLCHHLLQLMLHEVHHLEGEGKDEGEGGGGRVMVASCKG